MFKRGVARRVACSLNLEVNLVSPFFSSVVPGSFVLPVYSAVPALAVCLYPSALHVVTTFADTVLFPLLCSVPLTKQTK
jgi:hypothetical protein